MRSVTPIRRRTFLRAACGVTAGLVIGFRLPLPGALAEEEPQAPEGPLPAPNAFLRIAPDESVTVVLAHTELGQGIWTCLPLLVAEELGCDWERIRVGHAPAAPVYRHTVMGLQMTGGSTTTWSEFNRYRQAGALAREMLVRAAAKTWNVEPSACRAEKGFVVAGEKRASYGSLASAAESMTPPTSVTLKERGAWILLGKPTKRLDSRVKVLAEAQFGQDVRFPGLMTALVARSPVFGGRVKAFRPERAAAVPGVKRVVQVPSGVAVVADGFWAAKLGRDALEIDWDLGEGANLDTVRLRDEYRRLADTPGTRGRAAGDVDSALKSASQVLAADYEVPYLAHSPMEPLNCTVRITPDGCEIWTGTQGQTADQAAAAKILGLAPEKVALHTMFAGGGFGRRGSSKSDFVSEAVHVAKACGLPVKVIWTREDDVRGGFYRPMALHRIRAALDEKGLPAAWRHVIVAQSIGTGTAAESRLVKNGIDKLSVEGVEDSPYLTRVPNHLLELHSPRSPIPVLWWRSVGHSHTAFAMECFLDELAHAAKVDPLEYRRGLLKDHPRHRGALELAASRAGWGSALPAGRFRGCAVHASFGSYVAVVAEVAIEKDEIRVLRAVVAIDCGTCVNPEAVRAQMEGGVAFALSAALRGELTLREGRVEQSNFHDYPLLRIAEMPRVEAFVVPSTEKPGGVGETAVPPTAPAVANAVFAATGRRLRRLPLSLRDGG